MQELQKGKFFGISKQQFKLDGLTIVESSFSNYADCPWHYHNNAHFAFTTSGSLTETHRKQKLSLSPGSLVYNHSQEPHCNGNYSAKVLALHVDIEDNWFHDHQIRYGDLEGIQVLENPLLKQIFYQVFREVNSFDAASQIAIEALILEAFQLIFAYPVKASGKWQWISRLIELLHARCSEKLSLQSVAAELNIHPVYLCQQFPLLFHCTFGEYIRKLRVDKAVKFLLEREPISLTEMAYACGFTDQSHFIRTFKKNVGVTPLVFKKYLSK